MNNSTLIGNVLETTRGFYFHNERVTLCNQEGMLGMLVEWFIFLLLCAFKLQSEYQRSTETYSCMVLKRVSTVLSSTTEVSARWRRREGK